MFFLKAHHLLSIKKSFLTLKPADETSSIEKILVTSVISSSSEHAKTNKIVETKNRHCFLNEDITNNQNISYCISQMIFQEFSGLSPLDKSL